MLTLAEFNLGATDQTTKSRSQALVVAFSGLVFIVLVLFSQLFKTTRSVLGASIGCVIGAVLIAVAVVWDGYLQVAGVVDNAVTAVGDAAKDTAKVVGNAGDSVGQFLGGQSSDATCQPGFAQVGALCYKQLNCPQGYTQDGRVCKMQTGDDYKEKSSELLNPNPPSACGCRAFRGARTAGTTTRNTAATTPPTSASCRRSASAGTGSARCGATPSTASRTRRRRGG